MGEPEKKQRNSLLSTLFGVIFYGEPEKGHHFWWWFFGKPEKISVNHYLHAYHCVHAYSFKNIGANHHLPEIMAPQQTGAKGTIYRQHGSYSGHQGGYRIHMPQRHVHTAKAPHRAQGSRWLQRQVQNLPSSCSSISERTSCPSAPRILELCIAYSAIGEAQKSLHQTLEDFTSWKKKAAYAVS